jgi:hypothetical protein
LTEIAGFAQEFVPGKPVPRALAIYVADNFVCAWNLLFTHPLENKGRLEYLVNGFRPFWQQHGPAYISAIEERERLEKAAAKANAEKGRSGAKKKARKKWVGFTQDFVHWANRRKVTSELIDSGPRRDGIPETKGREFLLTLLTAKGNVKSMKSLEETLASIGIRLPQEAAEECFSILFHRTIPEN